MAPCLELVATPERGKKRGKANYVYARMSSKNPYLGNFHHAPPAGNVGAKYFKKQLTSEEEIEKQKAYRNNPLIGTFHPASESILEAEV